MNARLPAKRAGGNPERRGTRYFPEGFYSLQADQAIMRMATTRALPTPMRLYWMTVARANKWGHAAFYPGEMGKLLNVKPDTRSKAMNTLKSAQIIAPESTTQCVVLSSLIYRRATQSIPCSEPKHRDIRELMWIPGMVPPWESAPGEWQATLSAGDVITLNEKQTDTEVVEVIQRTTKTRTTERTAVIAAAQVDAILCRCGQPARPGGYYCDRCWQPWMESMPHAVRVSGAA